MEFTIKIAEEDLKVLSSALVRMPYKDVAILIDRINGQLRAQLEAQNKAGEQHV